MKQEFGVKFCFKTIRNCHCYIVLFPNRGAAAP